MNGGTIAVIQLRQPAVQPFEAFPLLVGLVWTCGWVSRREDWHRVERSASPSPPRQPANLVDGDRREPALKFRRYSQTGGDERKIAKGFAGRCRLRRPTSLFWPSRVCVWPPGSAPRRLAWLQDVGTAVLLVSIKIQAGELAGANEDLIVCESLFEPPGVKTQRVGANQAAGIRDATDVLAQVSASLSKGGDVELQALHEVSLAEIDIHGSADATPVGYVASCVEEEVVNRDHIEDDALVGKLAPLSAPIAQHVRAVGP